MVEPETAPDQPTPQTPGAQPAAAQPAAAQPAAAQPAPKPQDLARLRRRRLFAAVVVGAPLLLFLAAEARVRSTYETVDPRPFFTPGIYRSAEPPVCWELLPSYQGVYHQQTELLATSTNALSMRDPELTPARREARQRVLLLGDSVAFGRGVADERTFARRLEARWSGSAVFNSGVPGYDTRQELERLRRLGPGLRPQLVVLEWYRNDVLVPSDAVAAKVFEGYLVPLGSTEADFRSWKSRYVTHTHPADWSALIRLLRIHWKNFRTTATLDERAERPWELKRGHDGFERSLAAIREMRDWCKEHAAQFVVVMFPAREEVEEDGPQPDYPALLGEFCRAEQVRFSDLTARWREHWKRTGQTLYLPRDRCHPNAEGHEQVATWLSEELGELLPK
ncbi:MAG: SGNH/GDSL hydrolase family protein [Planctomycetota bacterium]